VFGGIDPKLIASQMKKMGIKTEDVEASEVIIKGPKTIVIKEPHVTMIDMGGQKTFQVIGKIHEKEESTEDIELIMEQTGASEEEARTALDEAEGDLAVAILKLKKG
jgi:nascent polypeptide-associated complex subunit alpha